MKIIVIDDETALREVIKANLRLDAHEVIEAFDGVEGLRLIQTAKPDLIITDIRMPNMDGDELFRILRSVQNELSIIPFIFLSGGIDENGRIQRLNNGADDCLLKPVHMPLLRASVNSCLSRSKREFDFMKHRLNSIANSFPGSFGYDISSSKSLAGNLAEYADVLIKANRYLDSPEDMGNKYFATSPIDYVRFCLDQLDRMRHLTGSINSETLTWLLILMVAEAQFAAVDIFVSDLYVSVPAAKTTINT